MSMNIEEARRIVSAGARHRALLDACDRAAWKWMATEAAAVENTMLMAEQRAAEAAADAFFEEIDEAGWWARLDYARRIVKADDDRLAMRSVVTEPQVGTTRRRAM